MTESFIDRAYKSSGNDEMRKLYNEWAQQYDADLKDSAYMTPARVADALKAHLNDRSAPILDYGCGTGLSGEALAAAGFSVVDGADLSEGMLDIARQKQVYRNLWQVDPDKPLPVSAGAYQAITAAGVISVGAAPGAVFDDLVDLLEPGQLLVFSMNDQSLQMEAYAGRLKAALDAGRVRLLHEAHGPHVSKHGSNSGSTVYVLEKLG